MNNYQMIIQNISYFYLYRIEYNDNTKINTDPKLFIIRVCRSTTVTKVEAEKHKY